MSATNTPVQPENRNLSTLKSHIDALTPERLQSLNDSVYFRQMQSELRSLGWTNLVLGAFTLWIGVAVPGEYPLLKTMQAVLGFVAVILSLASIVSPQSVNRLVWAGLFLLCGVWNVAISLFFNPILWIILGLLQIWWAVGFFRSFQANRDKPLPDAADLALYDDLMRRVRNIRSNWHEPEYVRFVYKRRWWQALLLSNRAIIFSPRRSLVAITDRDKIAFSFQDGKGLFRKRIAGTVQLDSTTFKRVTFPIETYEHYSLWQGASQDKITEWLNELDASMRRRRPVRFLIILALAAPFIILLGYTLLLVSFAARYS